MLSGSQHLLSTGERGVGPLAEEGIGANHSQLDLLEYIVESMQQRPMYLRALMAALLFQEICRIDACAVALQRLITLLTSAEKGSPYPRSDRPPEQYHVDLQMKGFRDSARAPSWPDRATPPGRRARSNPRVLTHHQDEHFWRPCAPGL